LRLEEGLAVAVRQLGLGFQAADPIGLEVTSGIDRHHAWRRQRRGNVDRLDGGMRMRRAQKRGVQLAFEIDVVGEPAAAREQALVLLAPYRLSDAELLNYDPLNDM
jgi:hypothetical protein